MTKVASFSCLVRASSISLSATHLCRAYSAAAWKAELWNVCPTDQFSTARITDSTIMSGRDFVASLDPQKFELLRPSIELGYKQFSACCNLQSVWWLGPSETNLCGGALSRHGSMGEAFKSVFFICPLDRSGDLLSVAYNRRAGIVGFPAAFTALDAAVILRPS